MKVSDGLEVNFCDGHKPGETEVETKLLINAAKISERFVSIFDNLLENRWTSRIYEYSLTKTKPWGVYIPTSDVLNPDLHADDIWEEDPERSIALFATRELLFQRGKGLIGDDTARIAGTAVWCLSSGVGDAVQYHIDYAELFRYETNVICPPLYAGTYHVSPFESGQMAGGNFIANLGGLEHYKKFGYKGRLASASALTEDIAISPDWIKVPYKCNRGIIYDGDLPHMSTPITSIRPARSTCVDESTGFVTAIPSEVNSTKNVTADSTISSSKGIEAGRGESESKREGTPGIMRRVILGFNCFPQRVDECCSRAPEHSDAFNRTIKLYQTVSSLSQKDGRGIDTDTAKSDSTAEEAVSWPKGGAISVKDVMKNPALARLLVLAAKKVKAQREKIP